MWILKKTEGLAANFTSFFSNSKLRILKKLKISQISRIQWRIPPFSDSRVSISIQRPWRRRRWPRRRGWRCCSTLSWAGDYRLGTWRMSRSPGRREDGGWRCGGQLRRRRHGGRLRPLWRRRCGLRTRRRLGSGRLEIWRLGSSTSWGARSVNFSHFDLCSFSSQLVIYFLLILVKKSWFWSILFRKFGFFNF